MISTDGRKVRDYIHKRRAMQQRNDDRIKAYIQQARSNANITPASTPTITNPVTEIKRQLGRAAVHAGFNPFFIREGL